MKKLYYIFAIALIILGNSINTNAQAPEGFTYQAEARDASGKLLTDKALTVETTILQGSADGDIVWQKDYTVTTDNYGMFSIVVGDMDENGTFSQIEWSTGTYFLNVKIMWAKKWLDTGTTQLLSVPYALYAKSAGSVANETDPVFTESPASTIGNIDIANWNDAFGWGDHKAAGYLKSFTETDPVYSGSSWFSTINNSNNWNTAFGWGNHADAGYLTNFTETDPVYSANFDLTGAANGDLLKFNGSRFVKYSPDINQTNYTYGGKYGVKLQARNDAQTHVDLVLSPKGYGSLLRQQPDGTRIGGNNRGNRAIDLQVLRSENTEVASGESSMIIGNNNNTASGTMSNAIGNFNTASGDWSTALGTMANATSIYTFATGYNSLASGEFSTAIGNSATASGNGSFSAGLATTAAGYNSTAMGAYTTAPSGYEITTGRFNTLYTPASTTGWNSNDRLFVVGNGTAEASRSNALTILKNANTTIGGSLTINGNGTSYTFPTERGTSGQVLKTNADGSTSWAPAGLAAETDPVWTGVSGNYYTKTNMQTSGQSQLHFNNLINKPSTVSGYGITDAMTTTHPANGITSTEITNWNAAFGWGDHAGLYRPITYVPAWSEITSNPFLFSSVTNNQLLKYNSVSGKWENWTPDYLTTGQAVTSVTGTGPIVSSGGTTPTISINPATTSEPGSMSAADKTKLDGIAADAEVNVNADWNATEGDAHIKNKPDLTVYATKDMASANITNLADPVNAQDAATKAYVDALKAEVNVLKLKVEMLAGTPVSELLAAGAAVEDLLEAGATIADLRFAGATINDLLAAGVTIEKLLKAKVPVQELLAAGVTVNELLTSGVTLQNLLNAGVTINDLLAAGATIDQFIGVEYQGGKIAYFLQSGDPGYDPAVSHGIIAAPNDQATCYWGPDEYNPAGTSTSIGAGAANTGIIVNTFQWDNGFAAKICNDLVLNGYNDWYLPSKDELNQLYLNKTAIGGFTELTGRDAYYWSSSVSNLGDWDSAWSQSFSGGYQSSNRIVYTWIHVRAVRSF